MALRRFSVVFSLCSLTFLLGFLFRRQLLIALIHLGVFVFAKTQHVSIDYQLVVNKAEGIECQDLHIYNAKMDIKAPLLRFCLQMDEDFLGWRPHVYCDYVEIEWEKPSFSKQTSTFSKKALQWVFAKLAIHIEEGFLLFGESNFAFFLETNKSREEKAHICLKSPEDVDLLHASITQGKEGYILDLELQDVNVSQLIAPFQGFLEKPLPLSQVEGLLDLNAKIGFSLSGEIQNLALDTHLDKGALEFQGMELKSPKCHLELFWKKTGEHWQQGLNAELQTGQAQLFYQKELALSECEASFSYKEGRIETQVMGELKNSLESKKFILAIDAKMPLSKLASLQASLNIEGEQNPLILTYLPSLNDKENWQLFAKDLDLCVFEKALVLTQLPFTKLEGVFSGSAQMSQDALGIKEFCFVDTEFDNLVATTQETQFLADKIQFQGVLQSEQGRFFVKQFEVEVKEGGCEKIFTSLNATARIENNELIDFTAHAQLRGHPCEIHAVASDQPLETLLEMSTSLNALTSFLGKDEASDRSVQVIAKVLSQREHWDFDAEVFVQNPLSLEKMRMKTSLVIAKEDLFSWDSYTLEAAVPSCNLSLLEPLCKSLLKEGLLEGEGAIRAKMEKGKLAVSMQPYFLKLRFPECILEETRENDFPFRPWEFELNLKDGSFNGSGMLYAASVSGVEGMDPLKNIRAEVEFKESRLIFKELVVNESSFQAKGSLIADFAKEPSWKLHWDSCKISLEKIMPILAFKYAWPSTMASLKGTVHSKADGWTFALTKEGKQWSSQISGKAQLFIAALPLSAGAELKNIHALAELNSQTSTFKLRETSLVMDWEDKPLLHGFIEALDYEFKEGGKFFLKGALKHYDKELLGLSLRGVSGSQDVMIQSSESQVHFSGKKVAVQKLMLDKYLFPLEGIFQGKHTLQNLKPTLELFSSELSQTELFLQDSSVDWVLSYLKNPELLRLTANLDHGLLELTRVDNGWLLEVENDQDMQGELFFEPKQQGWMIHSLKAKMNGAHLFAKGVWNIESGFLLDVENIYVAESTSQKKTGLAISWVGSAKLQGHLEDFSGAILLEGRIKDPFNGVIFNPEKILFSYKNKTGLFVPHGSLHYVINGKENSLAFHKLCFDKDRFSIEEVRYHLFHEELKALQRAFPLFSLDLLVEKDLSGTLKIVQEGKVWKIEGNIPTTQVALFDTKFPLKHLQYAIDAKNICLAAELRVQDRPLHVEMRVDFLKNLPGILIVKDRANVLKAGFEGFRGSVPLFHTIQGRVLGVEADLKRSSDGYFIGEINADLSQLSSLWGNKLFPLKGNIFLKGNYSIFPQLAFTGSLHAEKLLCCGAALDSLEAQVSTDAFHVYFTDLQVVDVAGTLEIKRARVTKELKFLAPLVQLNDFKPSLLRKDFKEVSVAQPFTIKKASVRDLEGSLRELQSLQGVGELFFTNVIKKEEERAFFSKNFMKDLGLDLSALIPSQGEVQFSLQDAKIYLTAARHVQSAAQRAELFLTDDALSFIDFSGNLHIDVNIRQNVALKFMEPFTLVIRGHLKKPRYQLR